MVQDFDWNLASTSLEMQLFMATKCRFLKHLSSLVQGVSKKNKIELILTILHSEFHSDQAYSRLRKSSDQNIVLKWRKFLTNQLRFKDHTACCIHSISLVWVPLESLFHALFENNGCYCDKHLIYTTIWLTYRCTMICSAESQKLYAIFAIIKKIKISQPSSCALLSTGNGINCENNGSSHDAYKFSSVKLLGLLFTSSVLNLVHLQ